MQPRQRDCAPRFDFTEKYILVGGIKRGERVAAAGDRFGIELRQTHRDHGGLRRAIARKLAQDEVLDARVQRAREIILGNETIEQRAESQKGKRMGSRRHECSLL